MGITNSFLFGICCVAAIAAVAFVISRKHERRHQLGLMAAQEWARAKAGTYPSDAFGEQVGLIYQEAVKAAAALIPHNLRRRSPMRGAASPRMLVAALSLSAAGLVGLVVHENYTERAVIPTQGDRPTVGFGSTFHEDGTPVKMGDTTTPVRALIKAQAHINREEAVFRNSLPGVALHQGEYDLYMDWVYQYGTAAWQKSGMRRELTAGNYRESCAALLDYRKLTSARKEGPGWEVNKRDAQGRPIRWEFDCSTPGNKVCRGVWTRQLERHQKCMGMQ